ncbi:MAG TPA: carboxypeptidase-like regulatory domain-containing protein [Nitrososphaerales archaeon]|nr:carboxypeptidase-like regulatory domain-containing protein [Nitrososphaerales archaeon]
MEVKLDDIDLVKRVQSSATSPLTEVRTVNDVHVDGKRSIVELRVPGSDGNVLQDMGREPLTILLKGEVWGPDAKTTVQSLKAKSDSGASVPFTSDLLAAASVSDVIIDEFEVDQIAGNPTRYRYLLLLREFKEGGEAAEGTATGADEVAEEEADKKNIDEAQEDAEKEGEVHGVRVELRDHRGEPIPNIEVTVDGPDGSRKIESDEKGVVVIKDALDGTYVVTIEDDRFKDFIRKIRVKKGEAA